MNEMQTVAVPRTVSYDDDIPLDVDGRVVGVLNANPASRRATLLVEEPAEWHDGIDREKVYPEDSSALEEHRNAPKDENGDPAGIVDNDFLRDGEMLEDKSYRQLQTEAKRHGIKANQSKDALREELREVY